MWHLGRDTLTAGFPLGHKIKLIISLPAPFFDPSSKEIAFFHDRSGDWSSVGLIVEANKALKAQL